jgi:tetratricopeptide (TPR) repeat protein
LKTLLFFGMGILVGGALAYGVLSAGAAGPGLGFGGASASGTADLSLYRDALQAPGVLDSPEAFAETDAAPEGGDDAEDELKEYRLLRFEMAHASLHALAGRVAECRQSLARAIPAGADSDELASVVTLLPEEDRVPTLQWLLEEFEDVEWDQWMVWRLYARFGDPDIAFLEVSKAIAELEEFEDSFTNLLIELAPQRAAILLMSLAEEKEWGAGAYVAIARQLYQNEQSALALGFLRTALAMEPNLDSIYELFQEIDPACMAEIATVATTQHPDNAGAWRRLADARMNSNDKVGAFRAYVRAAELGAGDSDDIFRALIRCDAEAALPALRKLVDPEDEETVGLLGHAYLANGLKTDAYNSYMSAHQKDMDDVTWLRCLVELNPGRAVQIFAHDLQDYDGGDRDEIIGAQGNAFMRLGDREAAFQTYLLALEEDDDDWEWLQGIAAAAPERAAAIIEKKLKDNADSRDLKGALADAYAGMGRDGDAIRLYLEVMENDSHETRWKISFAKVDPAAGLARLREEVANEPDSDSTWGVLADALAAVGRKAEAVEAYEKAVQLDPADWRWRSRLDALR